MVYVDNTRRRFQAMLMSHLWSPSEAEMDDLAERIGVRKWKQTYRRDFIHYDICESKRLQAIDLGAAPVSVKRLVILVMQHHSGTSPT